MLKVVAYARVSSREQEKEGFSIPAQLKLLEDYAQRNSMEIVQTFSEAETAKQFGLCSSLECSFRAIIIHLKPLI